MKFYLYNQNNSGGSYYGPLYVIVQARDEDHANFLAQTYGDVYFDGVSKGIDCECCGDRWYPSYNEEDRPSDLCIGNGYGADRADAPLCINAAGDVLTRASLPVEADAFDSDKFWK